MSLTFPTLSLTTPYKQAIFLCWTQNGNPSTLQAADMGTHCPVHHCHTDGGCWSPRYVARETGPLMAFLLGRGEVRVDPVPSPLPGPTLTLLWGLGLWQETGDVLLLGRLSPTHTSPETEERL